MDKEGQQRQVLVTGGAQGIGAAVAAAFAQRGDVVWLLDNDEEALHERAQIIIAAGGSCRQAVIDVADERQVADFFAKLTQQGESLDVIINNAGISQATPLTAAMDEWDRVIGVNLRGAYLIVKYAVSLIRSGGVIINIASTRAFMSEPDWHAYAASKGGIVALTHSLAVSLGPKGIRVNSLSPGWIDVSSWQKSANRRQIVLRDIDHKQHPAGRVGRPEDIAAACLFLASQEAEFITGTNLVVDGGMTVKMIYAED